MVQKKCVQCGKVEEVWISNSNEYNWRCSKCRSKSNFILLLAIVLCILLLPIINAQIQTLGTYKQNDCVNLKQICSNCSYVNITSVLYPNSTQVLGQVEMTKLGTDYNYTFCNTSILGQYIVNGKGDLNGVDNVWSYDFVISYDGTIISVGESIIYVIGMVFAFAIFLLLLYASVAIPFRNSRAEDGKIISVNNLKWAKVGAIAMCYVSLMFIFGLLTAITRNFLTTIGVTKFFEWLYWIMISLLTPLAILSIILGFIFFINDYVVKKKLKRRYWR